MKKTFASLFILVSVCFISCLDTEEKITINKDSSGIYALTIDMGGMMEQLKTLKPEESESLGGEKDTTILFKSYTDTATVLTREEKDLLEKGAMHILMKGATNEMKVVMEVPFKSVAQLLYLKQHMFELIDRLKPQENLIGENKNNDEADISEMQESMDKGPDPGNLLNPAQQAFSFTVEKNTISNKLTNKELYSNWIAKDSSMQMVMQMIPFMGDFNYTTTFVLPSAVKKYSGGSETKLSDDKKTITFINSLSGLMEKPESFEYSVEY